MNLRTLTGPVLVLALALSTALVADAQTSSVTTQSYTPDHMQTDLDKGCKALSSNTNGVVAATCNYVSGAQIKLKDSTLDVASKIRCMGTYGQSTAIGWSTVTNVYWTPKSWAVVLNSTGKAYLIQAVCTSQGGMKADASTLELGGTSGIENDAGSLAWK